MRVVNLRVVGLNLTSNGQKEKLKYYERKRGWWRRLFIPSSEERKKLMDDTSSIDRIPIDEWILILLYAQKERPITGKLMFVKQAFLLSHEVFPTIKEKFNFFPYSFGPYSKDFAETVNRLIKEKKILIEMKEIDEDVRYRFRLSQKGKEFARNAFEKLTDKEKVIIQLKRRKWDQLGYRGILHLVYTKYPEYAIYSKIKEIVV